MAPPSVTQVTLPQLSDPAEHLSHFPMCRGHGCNASMFIHEMKLLKDFRNRMKGMEKG